MTAVPFGSRQQNKRLANVARIPARYVGSANISW
jgi:hypothetical protein